jgi:hypothetical protein
MDDGTPALEVGFRIDTGGSFSALDQLASKMDTTEVSVLADAKRIEQATGGMVKMASGTAQIVSFGNAATREMQSVAVATGRAEKSGEAMVRQLQRQVETFGKTSAEIRQMRAELRATEAEQRGLTELAGRLRATAAEMDRLETSSGKLAGTAGKNALALRQVAVQMPDVVQGLLSGQPPMQVLIQQGGQLTQMATASGIGLRGMASAVGALLLPFTPLLAVLGAAAGGFALLTRWINQGVTNNQLTRDLGDITGGADATKQELYKLREETVSFGDTAKAVFSVVGKDVASVFVGDMKGMAKDVKSTLDDLASYGRKTLAGLYAGLAGTKAYLGEIEKGGVVGLAKMAIGQGDPKLLEKTYGAAYDVADKYLTKLGGRIRKAAVENTRERLAEKVGYNPIPKATAPKVDRTAERLARENEAIEAQIRNTYLLAEAYGASGAAALVAEARVKAESAAIRGRGDVELFVNRQIRLAIAERVRDASKSAAVMREQADVQTEINGMVAASNVPAERAAELLQRRMAELPLLHAIEAAQQRGLAEEVGKATRALEAQRSAQKDADAAAMGARFVAADSAADRRLAELREELRLVGATDEARTRALATVRATAEAQVQFRDAPANQQLYIDKQVEIAVVTERVAAATREWNDALFFNADRWDLIARNVQSAASGIAEAFGSVGRAVGDMASIYANFIADRARAQAEHDAAIVRAGNSERLIAQENARFALRSSGVQIQAYGDMVSAAKGFFKEGSTGYKAMAAAEKVYRVAQFAMSIQAMVQNAAETLGFVTTSAARATAAGAEGVATQAKLPFPANIAAMAATAAALAAAGIAVFSGGGAGRVSPVTNTGAGTVLGDPDGKSDSLKRSIDALKEVDTLMLSTSRGMAASLRSIDNQVGGFAALVVRAGDVNASAGVDTGFKANVVGSVLGSIPVIGGLLKGLFGTSTKVIGGGLYGGAQSLGSILDGGFDAATYSDVEKKKKLFGITTSTKFRTEYGDADPTLENQFTLVLRSFNEAIVAAAGPLGVATGDIEGLLRGFVVDIGKIDLKGLTGAEIQEKLSAVFGAAADNMATAAFPGFERFQKVGEGMFETLVRISSTVEAVTSSLDLLGAGTRTLGIDAKIGLADQFDSVGDLTSAVEGYFQTFYTEAEQAAAKTAQFGKVFESLGLSMPGTLAGFRQLVEAQDLTSAAGQATYATLLQLAPAFADLKTAMDGAKSAADVMAERRDLERRLLELNGDTAAIRALDLAKLDASNRGLQQQIYAVQDAQEAARAADELRKAWASVGDGIMDEVKRIRGLSGAEQGGGFAVLMGQFNAANAAARGGDQDAAKSLPGISQALLNAAALVATSRQELDRVQAETAASLEATYGAISGLSGAKATSAMDTLTAAASASRAATTPNAANDSMAAEIRSLREEVAAMRAENNAGHAENASANKRSAAVLEIVSGATGGDAFNVSYAA